MTLTSKKIEFNKVDVAASEDAKKKMREIAGNPTALPPQLCNGDQYCGGFAAFEEAVEAEELNQFLKL
jgi:glutaredoxin-related protein